MSPASPSKSGVVKHYENFWMAFACSGSKLVLFRVAFFALFALDAWLQVAHAPRYGHLDFNVAHFPVLDGILPMPTQTTMVLLYAAQTYLALRIMLGGVHRALYGVLALLVGYSYFISQLNSYQHHYLLVILLALLCAFPWPSLARQSEGPGSHPTARNWPVRMLLVALSVVYVYAALAKLDGEWTSGATLKIQLNSPSLVHDIVDTMGWALCAKLAILAELSLALLLHWRRSWPVTFVLGIGMHMSFQWAGLKIGLFSYFMIALYLLILPESWIAWLRKILSPALDRVATLHRSIAAQIDGNVARSAAVGLVALTTGTALVQLVPLDSVNLVTVTIALLALGELATRFRRAGSAGLYHLAACLLLLLLVFRTDALRDYYRFWGGNERRAGNHFEAMMAYEKVVELAPDYPAGHRSLGDLYSRLQRQNDALEQYQTGLALKPNDFALNRSAAQLFHRLGKGEEAIAAAERGLASRPKDKTLLAIRKHWQRQKKNHAP